MVLALELGRIVREPAVLMAVGLIGILIMMILPVPPIVLDLGLAISFAFAILIFTTTLFVERPLDFSSFPAILLVSLLLRLALNVSSTKLIIGQGHTGTDAAGGVIEGFAMFVMGGSLGVGLIVFSVLIIVNFLVITKGAGRMAEVGARFALDAMPGKQLAIDADVASGAISHEEAQRLRAREQQETAFLGSLDGVSKFVKGDALAGLLITGLNIVAGMAIGLLVHGLSLGEALQNYAVLTVGDGLVSQFPAVIISVAAALLLSKGRGEEAMDLALVRELGRRPEALATVAAAMIVFGLFPGLPILPFTAGGAALGAAAVYVARKNPAERKPAEPQGQETSEKENVADLLDTEDIHIEIAADLVGLLTDKAFGFDGRIERIRRFLVQEYGFLTPPVRVTDRLDLSPSSYRIKLQGVEAGRGVLRAGQWLALVGHDDHKGVDGEATAEPVYGAEARWVEREGRDRLDLLGITTVEPVEVLATHLMEVVQNHFPRLLTRRAVRQLLDMLGEAGNQERAEANRRLVQELVPDKIGYDRLIAVLRDLLSERIPIRNLPMILESLAEWTGIDAPHTDVTEGVRLRMAFQFVPRLQGADGELPVIELAPHWNEKLAAEGFSPQSEEARELLMAVRRGLDQVARDGSQPAVLAPRSHRRAVRALLLGAGLRNPVLAFEEVRGHARLKRLVAV
ncbi:MAG: flagellar biosynthesis protein FlhA [Parvularcula sp.]|jgi:flagellar biosynthesis protein FlhA|nr:flagellar biosynthesis protein FlhA [Parvularcula sp.]